MPRFVNLNALSQHQSQFVRSLAGPMPRNSVLLKPSPHQFYLTLDKSEIPPNVRIQNFIAKERSVWRGKNEDEKRGPKVEEEEFGQNWRRHQGRAARSKGGLVWALRER